MTIRNLIQTVSFLAFELAAKFNCTGVVIFLWPGAAGDIRIRYHDLNLALYSLIQK